MYLYLSFRFLVLFLLQIKLVLFQLVQLSFVSLFLFLFKFMKPFLIDLVNSDQHWERQNDWIFKLCQPKGYSICMFFFFFF